MLQTPKWQQNKIQMRERFKRMLFIRTKYENLQGHPLYEATKWHLNKTNDKNEMES